MSIKLKIKSKTLAEEARIIKREENKARDYARYRRDRQKPITRIEKARAGFVDHRKHVVRPEARATFLARAFIRGAKYRDVETPLFPKRPLLLGWQKPIGYLPNLLNRIVAMVNKYSDQEITVKDVEDWIKDV